MVSATHRIVRIAFWLAGGHPAGRMGGEPRVFHERQVRRHPWRWSRLGDVGSRFGFLFVCFLGGRLVGWGGENLMGGVMEGGVMMGDVMCR